jgi:hypothetical protein
VDRSAPPSGPHSGPYRLTPEARNDLSKKLGKNEKSS